MKTARGRDAASMFQGEAEGLRAMHGEQRLELAGRGRGAGSWVGGYRVGGWVIWGRLGAFFRRFWTTIVGCLGALGGLTTSESSILVPLPHKESICRTRRDWLGGRLAGTVISWTAGSPPPLFHCAPPLSFLCLQPPPHMLPSLLA